MPQGQKQRGQMQRGQSQAGQGGQSRKWRKYSREDFEAAVAEVRAGASARATAAKWGIPRSTLLDNKGKDRLRAPHPNRAISEEEEAALVGYALWMADRGFPLTRTLMKAFALAIVKASGRENLVNVHKGLSEMWWARFRTRHPELSMRQADTLERSRVHAATPEVLQAFFELLEPLYEGHHLGDKPHLIYNCDETGFGNIPRSKEKVLCVKGRKHIYRQQHTTREHITVHCCVSAAGVSIPPFIIYPRCLPSSAYSLVGPPDALYGVSEKGYMDGDLFLKWLRHFLRHAPAERPLVLFVDRHETHVSLEVISFCRESSIEMVCLPAHTTHILQPLDVSLFGPLKREFDAIASNAGIVRGDLVVEKARFSEVLRYAYPKAVTPSNIQAGFRKTGLFPLNREAVSSDQVVRASAAPTSAASPATCSTAAAASPATSSSTAAAASPATSSSTAAVASPATSTSTAPPVSSAALQATPGVPPSPCPTCGVTPHVNPLVAAGVVPDTFLSQILVPPTFGPRGVKRRLPLAGRVTTADEYTEGLRQRAEEESEKVEQKRVRREEMERKREEKREKMVEMERRREEKRIEIITVIV